MDKIIGEALMLLLESSKSMNYEQRARSDILVKKINNELKEEPKKEKEFASAFN